MYDTDLMVLTFSHRVKGNNKEMQSVITHLYRRVNSSDNNDRSDTIQVYKELDGP